MILARLGERKRINSRTFIHPDQHVFGGPSDPIFVMDGSAGIPSSLTVCGMGPCWLRIGTWRRAG